MSDKDVTAEVDFDSCDIDSECLPLQKCVCGQTFGSWDFVLSIYQDTARECPSCKRKLYFRAGIRVYEVTA